MVMFETVLEQIWSIVEFNIVAKVGNVVIVSPTRSKLKWCFSKPSPAISKNTWALDQVSFCLFAVTEIVSCNSLKGWRKSRVKFIEHYIDDNCFSSFKPIPCFSNPHSVFHEIEMSLRKISVLHVYLKSKYSLEFALIDLYVKLIWPSRLSLYPTFRHLSNENESSQHRTC